MHSVPIIYYTYFVQISVQCMLSTKYTHYQTQLTARYSDGDYSKQVPYNPFQMLLVILIKVWPTHLGKIITSCNFASWGRNTQQSTFETFFKCLLNSSYVYWTERDCWLTKLFPQTIIADSCFIDEYWCLSWKTSYTRKINYYVTTDISWMPLYVKQTFCLPRWLSMILRQLIFLSFINQKHS